MLCARAAAPCDSKYDTFTWGRKSALREGKAGDKGVTPAARLPGPEVEAKVFGNCDLGFCSRAPHSLRRRRAAKSGTVTPGQSKEMRETGREGLPFYWLR